MTVLDLLARMESTSGSLVLPKKAYEGTVETQSIQEGSPGSLSYPCNNPEKHELAVIDQLNTVCKCGYRRPFCACGFYQFSG